MGKTIGYIVAVVAVVVVIYLVVAGGKGEDPKKAADERQVKAEELNTRSFAKLTEMAITMRNTIAEARAKAPDPNMVPAANYGFLERTTLEDKGTVIRTEEAMGRGTAWVDLNGDSQPDLQLQFGARPVPQNITQGITLDLEVTLKKVDLVGDSLQLVGEAKKAEPVSGN